MQRISYALVLASLLGACAASTEPQFRRIETLYVAASTVTCSDWYGPTTCLQVRRDPTAPWLPFLEDIQGFTHEPGFEYELRVLVFHLREPPADGSSEEYRLAHVVRRVAVR